MYRWQDYPCRGICRSGWSVDQLYSQLGITESILNGTANNETMQNYYSRLIEPIISAIVDGMRWKYLTQKARDNGETIMFFRDPFKLVSANTIPDVADKLTRNEIFTPNEIRQMVGRKPVNDDKANELRNRNISAANVQEFANVVKNESSEQKTEEKE